MKTFSLRRAAVAACLSLFSLSSPAGVLAQDASGTDAKQAQPAADTPKGPNWVVNCSNAEGRGLLCAMSQTIFVKETGQRVLSATLSRNGEDGLAMVLALPHGIMLASGVTVSIDDQQPTTLMIEIADQNGSYATWRIDPATVTALKKGNVLNTSVMLANRKPLKLQLPLAGFSASLADLK